MINVYRSLVGRAWIRPIHSEKSVLCDLFEKYFWRTTEFLIRLTVNLYAMVNVIASKSKYFFCLSANFKDIRRQKMPT